MWAQPLVVEHLDVRQHCEPRPAPGGKIALVIHFVMIENQDSATALVRHDRMRPTGSLPDWQRCGRVWRRCVLLFQLVVAPIIELGYEHLVYGRLTVTTVPVSRAIAHLGATRRDDHLGYQNMSISTRRTCQLASGLRRLPRQQATTRFDSHGSFSHTPLRIFSARQALRLFQRHRQRKLLSP